MPDCLDSEGIWVEVLRPAFAKAPAGKPAEAPQARRRGRPALFLDRDGVIVEEVGFLHRPEEVRLIPGAADVIAAANRARVDVVVLTNQSGIGQGLYGWPEFAATQERILAALAAEGAALDMVLACPFHPEGRPPYRHPDHPCRKPRPGMLLRAAARLGSALAASWIVGDRASDLEAGRAAGLAGGVHVLTGYGAQERAQIHSVGTARFEVIWGESVADVPRLVPMLSRRT